MIKWTIIVVIAVFLAGLVVTVYVTKTESMQHEKNAQWLSGQRKSDGNNAQSVVIVFSRSGNTHVLASHIAKKYNADIRIVTAEDYELGIPGWVRALYDARSNVASISPENFDLAQYETIYLGAPIWLHSPAPPIWQVAQNCDFTGKRVVLFNTFNSKFEQRFIDEFASMVFDRGATSFKHQHIKRGRIGGQIDNSTMLRQYDEKYGKTK